VGGGNNTASGLDATIGGGVNNDASGTCATVGGGSGNTASGLYATIGGGGNTASGDYATVGGGYTNIVSGTYATVGGGQSNRANGDYATVGGGYGNVITSTASYATIGGGVNNRASGPDATVGGGSGNTASGSYATIGGGVSNTASGSYATVPGGYEAVADHWGQMAYAGGRFATNGDAQASLYVMRRTSVGAGWTDLYLDGGSARLIIASGRTMSFDILVVGCTIAGESAGYRIEGVIENVGGTTALVGTPTVTTMGEDEGFWNVQVFADDTNDALQVRARGGFGDTVRWVATVRTAEVAWLAW